MTFNGTIAQTIGGSAATTFAFLKISNASGVSLAQNATVVGLLTIDSGTSLADGGFTLTANGGIANSGTHSGTGKITLTGGSAPHSLTGNGSYQNLELDDTQGASLGGSPTVNGTLTLANGRLTLGANSLIMSASAPAISR